MVYVNSNLSVFFATFVSAQAQLVEVCVWKDCKEGAASFSMDDSMTTCKANWKLLV